MKKIIVFVSVLAVFICIATTALAATSTAASCYGRGTGTGTCAGTGSLMWDANGNFVSKETFEANLDSAIADGLILAEDKDFYMDRYDWCATNGGGSVGVRGGRGMGRGCGRMR